MESNLGDHISTANSFERALYHVCNTVKQLDGISYAARHRHISHLRRKRRVHFRANGAAHLDTHTAVPTLHMEPLKAN